MMNTPVTPVHRITPHQPASHLATLRCAARRSRPSSRGPGSLAAAGAAVAGRGGGLRQQGLHTAENRQNGKSAVIHAQFIPPFEPFEPGRLDSGLHCAIMGAEDPMSIEDAILEKVRALSPDQQAELLAVADSLAKRTKPRPPLRSPEGLWENFNFSISEEDIRKLRREMWKNFPRDDI